MDMSAFGSLIALCGFALLVWVTGWAAAFGVLLVVVGIVALVKHY